MDIAFIPNDKLNRAIFCTTGTKHIYLLEGYTLYDIFNLGPVLTGEGTAGTLKMHPSGKAFYMSNKWKGLLTFNITDPHNPVLEQIIQLGYGLHYLQLQYNRLVISNHFLELDSAGLFHIDGDHRIHAFDIDSTTLKLKEDTKFSLDFNNIPGRFPARPHAVQIRQVWS